MKPVAVEMSNQQIREYLREIASRQILPAGRRQVPFNRVETVLCYGLFYLCDPHRYGGANIQSVPEDVKRLAAFFCRTPGSITSKMLNLDGSRLHGTHDEPRIFATFAEDPGRYLSLYHMILREARALLIGEDRLPDFLGLVSGGVEREEEVLVGQEELPASVAVMLAEEERAMKGLDRVYELGDRLTEKVAERRVRLAQHRFAVDVLSNCGGVCVFCGFAPRALREQSHLLRASHIKPWAVSNHRERVDVRNGLAACPMHDVAFDRGYLMVNGGYRIHRAHLLEQSMVQDPNVGLYFGETLSPTLLLPPQAVRPGSAYLLYHREKIFRG